MLTHFKVTNTIEHKANFQMHNIDSLVNFGFHESLSTLNMCYSTQIILASQPIELGELAILLSWAFCETVVYFTADFPFLLFDKIFILDLKDINNAYRMSLV